jgi:hypothetical protein
MTHGPAYDNALRHLAAADLAAVCRWLGIAVTPDCVRLSEALPAATQYADLVAQVDADRLAHVEFVRRPTSDLPQRMLEYRARIMGREPGRVLTQHVVLLAEGRVAARYVNGEEFAMRLHVTYLREQDPAELLADAALAPLAVLARSPSARARASTLREAFEVLARVTDPGRRQDLAGVASVLAAIHLDAATIELSGKEAGMPISLEGTVGGRSLEARAEARTTIHLLTSLLDRSFGPDPRNGGLATRLAELPHDTAVDAVLSAGSLAELLDQYPPSTPPG